MDGEGGCEWRVESITWADLRNCYFSWSRKFYIGQEKVGISETSGRGNDDTAAY